MENASKALLIAASVLIAILLIAFGMKIFTSTSGTTESVETTMEVTEIATFNSKFTSYVGRNKTLSQVKALANLVIANNSTSEYKVSFNGKDDASDITDQLLSINEGTHTVVAGYENGLVNSIIIDPKEGGVNNSEISAGDLFGS